MYLNQIAVFVMVNCILALSCYLPLTVGRLFICYGAVMSIGGVVAAEAAYFVPMPLALLCGGVAGLLYAGLVGLICWRLEEFLFAVVTLAIGELTKVLVMNSAAMGGPLGFKNVSAILVSPSYPLVFLSSFVVVLIYFEKSLMRKAFHFIKYSEVTAASLGIPVEKYRLLAISAGGFLAGVAGGLYIHTVGIIEPRMFGFESSIQILMFSLLGGYGYFLGPLVGAIILTITPETLRFSTSFRLVFYGLVLLLSTRLWPDGWFSKRFSISKMRELRGS